MNTCGRVVVLAWARVVVLALVLAPAPVAAQEKAGKRDDLDVTMQIIVDPNAKLPDEVVRHIPLPAARTNPSTDSANKSKSKPEPGAKGAERSEQAKELGRETSEAAKERAQEAAQQREEARNAKPKDRDSKDHGRPDRPAPPRPQG